MQTKLDLPVDLLARARSEAERRGSILEEFIGRALRRELERPCASAAGARTRFPIFQSRNPGGLRVSDEDIRQAEHEDDLRRSGLSA